MGRLLYVREHVSIHGKCKFRHWRAEWWFGYKGILEYFKLDFKHSIFKLQVVLQIKSGQNSVTFKFRILVAAIVAEIYLFKTLWIICRWLELSHWTPPTTNTVWPVFSRGRDLKSRKKNNTCCLKTDGKHFNCIASHFTEPYLASWSQDLPVISNSFSATLLGI